MLFRSFLPAFCLVVKRYNSRVNHMVSDQYYFTKTWARKACGWFLILRRDFPANRRLNWLSDASVGHFFLFSCSPAIQYGFFDAASQHTQSNTTKMSVTLSLFLFVVFSQVLFRFGWIKTSFKECWTLRKGKGRKKSNKTEVNDDSRERFASVTFGLERKSPSSCEDELNVNYEHVSCGWLSLPSLFTSLPTPPRILDFIYRTGARVTAKIFPTHTIEGWGIERQLSTI